MIHATNRKLDGTADGTDTEISSHLTYTWRVRINQAELYNKKEGAPTEGLGKMAKNESLPAHLQENDSRGDDHLTLYERHENPPPIDQGLTFQTHALQMILLGPFCVRT